jgi:hypothetical protein
VRVIPSETLTNASSFSGALLNSILKRMLQ